jgi:DEAD/DEAH box helicase domain-containing protein
VYETPVLCLKFSSELAVRVEEYVCSERLAIERQFPKEEDRPERYNLQCGASPLKLAYHCLLHGVKKPILLTLLASEKDVGEFVDSELGAGYAFDAVPEGSGSVHALFNSLESAIAKGREWLSSCDCTGLSGCPRCLSDRQCLDLNDYLPKLLGMLLLNQFQIL